MLIAFPVLPLLASTMVSPGRSSPSRSARSIMYLAMRALMDPEGLRYSSLAHIPSTMTSGVLPIASRIVPPARGSKPAAGSRAAPAAMPASGSRASCAAERAPPMAFMPAPYVCAVTPDSGTAGRPTVPGPGPPGGVRSLLGDLLARVDERLAHGHAAVAPRGGLDLEHLAERLSEPDRQHRVADVCLQARRVAGGGHLSDLLAAQDHRVHVDHLAVDVGADRRPLDLDADKLAPGAFGLDAPEGLLADEVGLLAEVDHPGVAHVDLEGVRVVPHVAAERQDAPLDSANVAGADHLEPVRPPGLEHRVPQPGAVL